MLLARSRSVDETKALAAALAELARPGDLILLAGELGAGKTAFAQGFGKALGVVEPITSPTFTLASQYEGRLELNHLDVYRLDQLTEVLDIGLPEMLDEGGVTLVEWGDAIIPALPADYLLVRLTYGDADDDRILDVESIGPRWSARSRALSLALGSWLVADLAADLPVEDRPVEDRPVEDTGPSFRRAATVWWWLMLILGIDTATVQVSCAIGGHEGVLASTLSARGKRHAESLTPAIDFICRQARIELSEISVVAVDLGPGLFTGLRVGVAAAKAMAHALRVPMIGVPSLDLLAFPARFSSRLVVAVIDARRGEVFYAFYRQVPGGMQRLSDHRVGTADDLAGELLASGEECLLVGDGAIRYREVFDGLNKVDVVGAELAHPSASSLVMLAHAQALREQFVKPWDLTPMYLRKPDAEINWTTRETG